MATGGNINFDFDECQYFKGKYMKVCEAGLGFGVKGGKKLCTI